MSLIPYSNLVYFYILILLLLPAVLLGLLQVRIKYYGLIASMLMLFIVFGDSLQQSFYFIVFFILQLILVMGYSILAQKTTSKWLYWILLILSLLPLIYTKYGSVMLFHEEVGFLGISYLTFKTAQMLTDIHKRIIKKVNFFDYCYFILFLPTLSSGPIDRWQRFVKDTDNKKTRKEYLDLLGNGVWKIMMGVGYKFVIGFLINYYWLSRIKFSYEWSHALSYMYAYSFYLFFDFAGYSMMAVGVSYILGIRTPDNFNLPFISRDIKDFWNRWHMTLSFWFRDYVYTRFVMACMKKKVFKSKYTISYIGYVLTMGLMGIWHGGKIYYILYGLYHAALIILTDVFQRKCAFYQQHKEHIVVKYLSIFVTFQLVCLGFLLFSGALFEV